MAGPRRDPAAAAPVEEPAAAADNSHRQPWFVHEVEVILAAALARDDARQPHRCPTCGQRASDKARS